MDLGNALMALGTALGLGLLVGLERQRAHGEETQIAGLRTFALVSLAGAVMALLAVSSPALGGWPVAVGLLGVITLSVMGNTLGRQSGVVDPGQTTEAALLVMYGVGALAVVGPRWAAVAVGGTVMVLLQAKQRLHGAAQRIGEKDLTAIARFVLVALVVLPTLPDRGMGPWGVLNPRSLWQMVVFIVGLNLAGYLALKMLGPQRGALIGGVLGGLVSSTATTVTYARRTRENPESTPVAALVIVVASAVVFVRILIEIAVVAPGFLPTAAPPLAVVLVVFTGLAALLIARARHDLVEMPAPNNPSELKPAFLFAMLYAGVLLAVAGANHVLGPAALYAVAGLAGLSDVDAFTLTTAGYTEMGSTAPETGWRLILVAALANLLFKAGAVAALGSRGLLWRVGLVFAVVAATGGMLIWLWPT